MTYDEVELRHTNDKVNRKNLAFTYENFTETPFWDTLKISYSHQKITTTARTDDYCDGNDKCALAGNPLGMKYNQDNQLVGKDGNSVQYKDIDKEISERKVAKLTKQGRHTWQKVDWDAVQAENPGKTIGRYCIGNDDDKNNQCTYEVKTRQKENTFKINGKTYDLLSDKNVISDEQRLPTNVSYLLSCDGLNCDYGKIQGFKKMELLKIFLLR